MLRKVLWYAFLFLFAASVSYSDVVFKKDGTILQGKIMAIAGNTLVIRNNDMVNRFALSDLKGFCIDGLEATYRLTIGEQFVGTYVGINETQLILRIGLRYEAIDIAAIEFVHPIPRIAVSETVIGIQNGIVVNAYSPLNLEIDAISSGQNLNSVIYTTGAYIESFRTVGSRFDIGYGAAFGYIPTAAVNLLNPDSQAFYGTLSVDTLKAEISIGGYFVISPSMKVGVSVSPSVNVSSVYETFLSNENENIYITHSTFGIRPAFEFRYTILGSLSLGLTAGYEVLSTCDGIYIKLQTGYSY